MPSLLAAKFEIPSRPARHISRKRLLARLDESLKMRLALVCAPSGFGKTTLVSEWAAAVSASRGQKTPVAWLALNEQDNNPAYFWSAFCEALNSLNRHRAPELAAWQGAPTVEDVTSLVMCITQQFPRPFALVIDDYHLVTDPAVLGGVNLLLRHMPPQMHLVIISRAEPDLPLTTLRSRDQMIEVRSRDLCFTPDETRQYLRLAIEVKLSSEAIDILHERTEGWITGLKLAAHALQSSPNPGEFVRLFAGANRLIGDYLAEQVLNSQPPEAQQFLLETSILKRLNGYLCNAVTGRSDSQEMLERLEKANLFLEALDQDHCWYRYHPLLAEFLQQKLVQARAGQVDSLYYRAAHWCETNGLTWDAVQYFLLQRDYDRAASLIYPLRHKIFEHSAAPAMLGWMKALPEKYLHSQPDLCLCYAWSLTAAGRFDKVEPLLQAAQKAVEARRASGFYQDEEDSHQETLGNLHLLRACALRFSQPHKALESLELALQSIPAEELDRHSLALLFRGQIALGQGRFEQAEQDLLWAIREGRIANNLAAYLGGVNSLGLLRVEQGRLRVAMSMFAEATQFIQAYPEPALAGIDLIRSGDILREQNKLELARQNLESGLKLAEQGGDFVFIREGFLAMARLENACSNPEIALEYIHEARQLCLHSRNTQDIAFIDALRARLGLENNDLAAAEYWSQQAGLADFSASDLSSHVAPLSSLLVFARLCYAQDRQAEAQSLLEQLDRRAQVDGLHGRRIEILSLSALLQHRRGQTRQALQTLEQALLLAEPEGYLRIFVDLGQPLAAVLAYLHAANSRQWKSPLSEEYVYRLRKAFSAVKGCPVTPIHQVGLVEQLSERELQVLRLIAAGMTYEDIAAELVVAVSTVQWHIKNIYQKLNVHSGLEATAAARELGLL
jgi:LuxR family maltose regulon positive regulatory protein